MSLLLDRVLQMVRSHLMKNAAALIFIQISGYAAPFLVVPYLSRVLSVEHYGLISYATGFNLFFMTLVDYGFNLTATRRVAINTGNAKELSEIYSSVTVAKALLAALGFVILTSVVVATPKLRPNLPLFALSYLAVLGDVLFPVWLFQGLQKMHNLVWRDLLAKLVSMGLTFMFVRRDSDYLWAAAFQSSSMLFAGIIGLMTVPLFTPARFVIPTRKEIVRVLREGRPVFLSVASASLIWPTNFFIVGLRCGAIDIAYYSAAYRFIGAARALVSPVIMVLYPHISHLASASEQRAKMFLNKYTLLLVLPVLAGSFGLFLAAPTIIRITYSTKYEPAILLVRILAFSPVMLVIQHIYSTFYMLAFGRDKEWSHVVFWASIFNFVCLGSLVFWVWPPMALSITQLAVDLFTAAAAYRYFLRNTSFKRGLAVPGW